MELCQPLKMADTEGLEEGGSTEPPSAESEMAKKAEALIGKLAAAIGAAQSVEAKQETVAQAEAELNFLTGEHELRKALLQPKQGTIEETNAETNAVTVSMVYPADATPGHLLSVVPDSQLAQLKQRELMLIAAQKAASKPKPAPAVPPVQVEALVAREPVVAIAQPRPAVKPKPKPAGAVTEPKEGGSERRPVGALPPFGGGALPV
jgi:hypothetical protein